MSAHRREDREDGDPTVLYIGGFGRSGSTLVERVAEATPQAVSLGEVVHLWQRGVIENELCGCGTPFSECAFWREIGDRAFGGWATLDVHRVLQLQRAVDRQRHVLRTLRPMSSRVRGDILRYTDYYRAVYAAAREVSGADIVVDSSKHASLAIVLGNDPRLDLRVLHLVRDSVAVAYSWSKEVNRPETADRAEGMTRYSSVRASTLWSSNNVLAALARVTGTPVARLRYEDFVAAPSPSMRRVWKKLRLPGDFEPEIGAGVGVELARGHSIGGNPMRFREGPTVIRPDDGWRTAMATRDRVAVKVLTAPLRAWLGYLAR